MTAYCCTLQYWSALDCSRVCLLFSLLSLFNPSQFIGTVWTMGNEWVTHLVILKAYYLPFSKLSLSHTHTHTHTCFTILVGTSIGVMVFYCTDRILYRPTPTLHLNLALTGDILHFYIFKKLNSVWFISLFTHGDLNLGPHRDTSPHEAVCIQV